MLVLAALAAVAVSALPSSSRAPPHHDIARLTALAELVSVAHCPSEVLGTAEQATLGSSRDAVAVPNVITSSASAIYDDWLDGAPDMSWYMAQDGHTLRLVFSSLPTTDDVLELLSEDTRTAPIPHGLAAHSQHVPHVHAQLVPALQSHGVAAFNAVFSTLEHHHSYRWVEMLDADLNEGPDDVLERPTTVQVIGHGWGAATALVVATAIWNEMPNRSLQLDVQGTFFGLPAVGGDEFSAWVEKSQRNDRLSALDLVRISHLRDPVVLLPPPHTGYAHPPIEHVVVGGGHGHGHRGKGGHKLGQSRVADHEWFGSVPFAGQCVL